jgi:hypothetical protein
LGVGCEKGRLDGVFLGKIFPHLTHKAPFSISWQIRLNACNVALNAVWYRPEPIWFRIINRRKEMLFPLK